MHALLARNLPSGGACPDAERDPDEADLIFFAGRSEALGAGAERVDMSSGAVESGSRVARSLEREQAEVKVSKLGEDAGGAVKRCQTRLARSRGTRWGMLELTIGYRRVHPERERERRRRDLSSSSRTATVDEENANLLPASTAWQKGERTMRRSLHSRWTNENGNGEG